MTTIVLTSDVRLDSLAGNALDAAARLWFAVAVSGQLMMAAYVAWFYGSTALQGQVQAWNRVLTQGIVRGDAAGNSAVSAHLIAAVVLIVSGALQFVPRLRERFPAVHRWSGRIYLPAAVAGSLSGLYLTWIRGTRGDLTQHIGGSLNAALILVCVVLALRTAIKGRIADHRRWATRLYLLVSASWFYRVGLFLWLLVNRGPVGFDPETFTGPALTFFSFANSLIPLAVLELYFHARTRAGAQGRLGMATVLFALTAVMAAGIFAATLGMWLPIIRTGTF